MRDAASSFLIHPYIPLATPFLEPLSNPRTSSVGPTLYETKYRNGRAVEEHCKEVSDADPKADFPVLAY